MSSAYDSDWATESTGSPSQAREHMGDEDASSESDTFTYPGSSTAVPMPNYDALVRLLDATQMSPASHSPPSSPPPASIASALSPTPLRLHTRPEDEDMTTRSSLYMAEASTLGRKARDSLEPPLPSEANTGQEEVLRLRAEVERLKAVVAAATESRATAVKQSDEAVSLAAHDLLKHLVTASSTSTPLPSLALALRFVRHVDALVYPTSVDAARPDEAVFAAENLERLFARIGAWQRLARQGRDGA